MNFTVAFFCFLGALTCAWIIYKDATEWDVGAGVAFGGFGVVGFLIGFAINFLEGLKILIAPKVWLLEYAASLLKGTS